MIRSQAVKATSRLLFYFISTLSITALLLALLVLESDYRAARGRHVSDDYRFATKDEVTSILRRCGVSDVEVVPSGAVFHFGWAWNGYEKDLSSKRPCFDRGLDDIRATATTYDAMG